MNILFGMLIGFAVWFVIRYGLSALYTVDQNERAVKTIFWTGRTRRRYNYRQLSNWRISDRRAQIALQLSDGACYTTGWTIF